VRNIDTMDAKDWIILRLLKLCTLAPQLRGANDFANAAFWVANNIDIFTDGPRSVHAALRAAIARENTANEYICTQWPQPDSVDAIVPFEALLTSVQTNDN